MLLLNLHCIKGIEIKLSEVYIELMRTNIDVNKTIA